MKKYWMMMIVALCLPILASCGGNQSRENVETSTTATTSAKEVQKDMATKSNSEASISSSTTAPSTTVEREMIRDRTYIKKFSNDISAMYHF